VQAEALRTELNVPTGQGEQPVNPAEGAYVPSAHTRHADVPVVFAKEPAGQLTQLGLPVGEDVPTAQGLQVVLEDEAAKVPAAHDVHCDAPAAENLPGGQAKQLAFDACPVAALYVPAGQLVHEMSPTFARYVPTAHGEHTYELLEVWL